MFKRVLLLLVIVTSCKMARMDGYYYNEIEPHDTLLTQLDSTKAFYILYESDNLTVVAKDGEAYLLIDKEKRIKEYILTSSLLVGFIVAINLIFRTAY